jgi:transcription initiation factor TFIIB
MVYRKAIRKNIVKGRSIRAVVSASIYMATRKCKVVRTLDDVAKAANLERKELSRTYRFMLRSLKTEVPRSNPHNHLSVFISQLGLSGATELMAKEIIDQASSTGLTSGRGPVGIAAASVYVAGQLTGESRTQGEIARSMNVTEVTIRNRYKELVKKLSIEIKM